MAVKVVSEIVLLSVKRTVHLSRRDPRFHLAGNDFCVRSGSSRISLHVAKWDVRRGKTRPCGYFDIMEEDTLRKSTVRSMPTGSDYRNVIWASLQAVVEGRRGMVPLR
jgi:hypothetical protein